MKAYVYTDKGAEIIEIAAPKPVGTQVLIKVKACGLNRADLGMTKGHAHGAAGGVGTVLGMEWAGEIAELGPDAKGFKVGERVMGSGGAAFAEYTVTDHGRLFHIPPGMGFDIACTLPVALTTMHNALVTVGGLQAGQSVLIQGASSGVFQPVAPKAPARPSGTKLTLALYGALSSSSVLSLSAASLPSISGGRRSESLNAV